MLHINAETEKRGQRFAEISAKFPKLANIIRARTEFASNHYQQWLTLTNQELSQLELFFTNMPFIQDYFARRRLHPTYQELLIILENKLSLRIFELVNLTALFDVLDSESEVFLKLVILADQAELLNEILAYASVKQLLKPDFIRRLLSLTKDHLSDLLCQIQRNDSCANVTTWLKLFSDFCVANNLQKNPEIPKRNEDVSYRGLSTVSTKAFLDTVDKPRYGTSIYQETIDRLEAYTKRVRDDGFSHGFKHFIAWQTRGRIANYNQAIKWLNALKSSTQVDREVSLAQIFESSSRCGRTPKRWHDFFTGITSKELASIERDVTQHIKIT